MARSVHLTTADFIERDPGHLSAEIDGELVLMSVAGGIYAGLDEIGGDIWRRLETPRTVADLCGALARDYDADPATIERDVLTLLDQLRAHSLIRVKD